MKRTSRGISKAWMLVLLVSPLAGLAQSSTAPSHRGEFYFSWGYNTEAYTRSRVKINQPGLGNNYTFYNVKGNDHRGWDEGLFSKALSIPQYNYRIGYFFNDKHDLGVEINFDHTKFIFSDEQTVALKGTLGGRQVDTSLRSSQKAGFYYYLNNGANFLLFNIVKRWHWYTNPKNNIKLDLLGKAGIGPVIPHVENSFFGKANDPHFQLGGWNTGAEGALRATFYHYVYLELCGKLDYARYSNLKIYEGTAKHAFGTAEAILNLGITFPTGKKR
ncbi:MAG TPA: hypothetical protein VLD19_06415 [Chitinophagaceae bacterium]|nr:hypothetical protein [Chitinophagaceae bacterium]